MIFVLDNYDSFTFNLVQYIGETGEEVQVRRNDQVTPEQIEEMKPRKIVISPGPCTPNEAGITLDLIRQLAMTQAHDDGFAVFFTARGNLELRR